MLALNALLWLFALGPQDSVPLAYWQQAGIVAATFAAMQLAALYVRRLRGAASP